MGRRSNFSDRDVFEAVGLQIAEQGDFRIQRLVDAIGVTTGSLYHRYGSREGVLAAAWLDALKAFAAELLPELRARAPDAGERAALVTPRFARHSRTKATILATGRQSQYLTADTSAEWRHEADAINDNIARAVAGFARRHALSVEACRYGVMAFPLAVVMSYLPSRAVPRTADKYVIAAYHAAIEVARR